MSAAIKIFTSADEAFEVGKNAAIAALKSSSMPIFAMDEAPCKYGYDYAMGWNTVWIGDENRARLARG